jgi:hypothetical protein
MKLKYLLIVALGIAFFACSDDDDDKKDNHDPVAQALIDDDILIEFLQTHYLTEEKEIDTILHGETPLYDIVSTDAVKYNEIDYKIYYYVDQEGIGERPTRNDSVQILYRGFRLDSIKFDENTTFTSNKSWFHLPQTIQGFRYGATYFSAGEKVIYPDESFGYEQTGSGVFFLPSGLMAVQVLFPFHLMRLSIISLKWDGLLRRMPMEILSPTIMKTLMETVIRPMTIRMLTGFQIIWMLMTITMEKRLFKKMPTGMAIQRMTIRMAMEPLIIWMQTVKFQ